MTEAKSTNTPVEAPWGSWQVLDDSDIYKVKKVLVKPGHRLSYQKHFKREEFWVIAKGQAEVTLDGSVHQLKTSESICIPKESAHRIANPSTNEDLIFIEVQQGSYFGEDDIVRLSDDYGRE